MLDVHPPHAPTHTWKDFFIHIVTIVIGLIIAVGLEQTVEWVRHNHERHQLQDDLRTEARNNLELMTLDYVYCDKVAPPLAALRSQARSLRANPSSGPQPADLSELVGNAANYFPDAPVWNSAKQGGLTVLLPRREAALYDLVYGQNDLIEVEFHRYEQDRDALTQFILRFTADPKQLLDLASLKPGELEEYIVLLANLQGELAHFRREVYFAQQVTLQAARGEATDQNAFVKIGVQQRQ